MDSKQITQILAGPTSLKCKKKNVCYLGGGRRDKFMSERSDYENEYVRNYYSPSASFNQ